MTLYTDTSKGKTPLQDAVFGNWFDHSYLIGNQSDPLEKQAFLSRFQVKEKDLEDVKGWANQIRNHGTLLQRSVVRTPVGGIQTPGIAEQLNAEKKNLLFFPDAAVSVSDQRRNLEVTMLRIPSSTGQRRKVLATVHLPSKQKEHGILYDIRLPAFLLSMEESFLAWNQTFVRSPDQMHVPCHLHLLSLYDKTKAWCSFNPTVFYTPLTIPLLSNNVQKTVSDPQTLFNSSLLMALIQHQIVPFLDSEEVNVHHAFLGRMQQAEVGLEEWVMRLRDTTALEPVYALQQSMNAILLFLLPLEAFEVTKEIAEMVKDFSGWGLKNLENQKIEDIKVRAIKGAFWLTTFIEAERHAPGWRIYASRILQINVNTLFCFKLFYLLVLNADTYPAWEELFMEERITALEERVKEERVQLRSMLERYGLKEGEEGFLAKATILCEQRKILRGAFLDVGRLLQQHHDLQQYQAFFKKVVDWHGTMVNAIELRDKAEPILNSAEKNLIPLPLLSFHYQWEGEKVAEVPFVFTKVILDSLLNKKF